jgi:hypothetical protein
MGKISVRFLAILIFACPLAFGFANVNVETRPDTVHVDSGAVPVNGTLTAAHNGEIHPGAFNGSVRIETRPDTIHGTMTVTTEKGTVEAPLTVNTAADTVHLQVNVPKDAVHLEFAIPPHAFDGAIVIHAENTTDTLAKPLQKFEQGLETVGARTELYLIYGAIGFVLLLILGVWALFHLKRHVVQEVAKAGQA